MNFLKISFRRSLVRNNSVNITCNNNLNLMQSFYKFSNNPFASKFSTMQMKEKLKAKKATMKIKAYSEDKTLNNNSNNNTSDQALLKQKKIDPKKIVYSNPFDAITQLKNIPQKVADQSINITVGLNVDPRKGNQVVRGIYKMPGGSNKIPRVMVFTTPSLHKLALDSGADFIADADTYKSIMDGVINFDKTVCTLETMPSLKNVGRILGPKGLMPSVKVGTACTAENLPAIIKDLKLGSKEFKTDTWGQASVQVGTYEFSNEKLMMNIDSFMKILGERKPEVIKSRYFLYAFLSTYKSVYRIDMKSMDPASAAYFYSEEMRKSRDNENNEDNEDKEEMKAVA